MTGNNPIIDATGAQHWRVNSKHHRLDGPAVILSDGSQFWFVNGLLHRLDGPAIIHANGNQCWCVNGRLHRLDGPAVIGADGSQEWYVNDNNITFEVNKWMRKNNITYPFSNESLLFFKLMFG